MLKSKYILEIKTNRYIIKVNNIYVDTSNFQKLLGTYIKIYSHRFI